MADWHSKLVSAACVIALTLGLPFALAGCVGQAHIRAAEAALKKAADGQAEQIAQPAPRKLTVEIGGVVTDIETLSETVGDVLVELNVTLGEQDRVEPDLAMAIEDIDFIRVLRVEVVEERLLKRIYFHEVRRPNNTLELGVTRTVQQGREGQRAEYYEVILENGVEVSRTLTSSEVLSERVDRIVEYGTVGTVVFDGVEYRFSRVIHVQATAYTAGPESTGKSPGHPLYGITFSGLPVQVGHIAVDPRVIPLLSKVYVEGLDSRGALFSGEYLATDTGSGIRGNRIDIYFEEVEDALWFGRRQMKVYILE